MEKYHIVITGRRNTGKSSLINNILGQEKSIVSSIPGTTTDPVKKSYEIPGTASVVFIDTAGTDDEGSLGSLRIEKTFQAIREADAAILTITGNTFGSYEHELIASFREYNLPFLILHNKSDLNPISPALKQNLEKEYSTSIIEFSALRDDNSLLIKAIGQFMENRTDQSMTADIISKGDIVMLITPIDSEAPTGRMILPQIQMLRDILDNRGITIVLQPEEIPAWFERTTLRPTLVITDSQAFGKVAPQIPEDILLTSFSIILAHHKGEFEKYLEGCSHIDQLCSGDRILILESCSHHISCEDIGRVKIPALLRKYTKKELEFDFIAGLDKIGRNMNDYAMVIQCGGCMITARQLKNRLQPIINAGIPVCNYGMAIAYTQGIFKRAIQPFLSIK